MGWNTREEGVREEILDSPLEESMSTTVNYDKYRDCDAAILEGLERLCRANPGREHSTSFSISPSGYPPKASRIFRPRDTPKIPYADRVTLNKLTPPPPVSNGRSRADLVIASLLVRDSRR